MALGDILLKGKIDIEGFWHTWIRVLDFVNIDNGIVVVEGKRDRDVLSRLLLEKNVVTIQSLPIRELEKLFEPASKVLILTDFDKEGELLADRLRFELTNMGLKINTHLREKVREAIKPIKQIEALSHLLEELLEKAPFGLILTELKV